VFSWGRSLIGVTGATGEVGSRLARRLADRGHEQRLIVRDASRVESLPGADVVTFGGYADGEGARRAFSGVSTVFLCSAKESEDRVSQHRVVVDAAVAAGVERIVYLSIISASPDATFSYARDHYRTEEYIRSTGLAFTFSRQSFYLDFLPHLSGADGVIRGPAGDGRFAPVLRDDVADALAAMLNEAGHEGVTYELTGPEAVTMTEVAALLTRLTAREVTFEDETLAEAYSSRAKYGAPDWEVEGWVSTYTAFAAGEFDVVTDHVLRLTGHQPVSIAEFIRASKQPH
jgi:NAD(P)H dehydrogenase (quinone)